MCHVAQDTYAHSLPEFLSTHPDLPPFMTRANREKPQKKSRIVSSADNPTTLTCTFNNARRLAQMRAVVLRTTSTSSRRRLGQTSTHVEMEMDEEEVDEAAPNDLEEVFNMDFAPEVESDGSDSDDDDMGPKRPPVCTVLLTAQPPGSEYSSTAAALPGLYPLPQGIS